MTHTTYVLKSQRGREVFSAQTLAAAERMQREAANHPKGAVHLRIFEVQTIEREIA